MENRSFQDFLIQSLHQLFPEAREDGARNNVLINCPLCIKEGKPDNKRHMSICLGNDGKPLFFNCFRNTSHRGILTSEALQQLAWNSNINIDPVLLQALDEFSINQRNINRYKLNKQDRFNFYTTHIDDTDINEKKRLYIVNRLGIDLSYEELERDKIVFSLKKFLYSNYIRTLTRDEKIIEMIDNHFVGFLTNNNSAVILRNMDYGKIDLLESINQRYIKYSIVQGTPSGYYIIPTLCNITGRIEIHIAEGTFDILSVFYNLRGGNRENNIYASIGGNSYLNIVRYFLCDMGIIDPIIHIYIDSDIKSFVLPQLKKILYPLDIETYIHINIYNHEKDFGVSKDRIKEYTYRL